MTQDPDLFRTVGGVDPVADPAELRDPGRRVRGRLVTPVTVWTAQVGDDRFGLTVSSVMIAEGEPPVIAGVLSPLSDFADALQETGRFTVHVLGEDDRRLAQLFAGRLLSPDPFEEVDATASPWGPRLGGLRTTVGCSVSRTEPLGRQQLVVANAEAIDVADEHAPLAYLRGQYRRLVPLASGNVTAAPSG
jgi:flavin reductase (DIM6/NTAB) family NADH-FMN oxidoreductase RutF